MGALMVSLSSSLRNEPIEVVTSFKYLGSTFTGADGQMCWGDVRQNAVQTRVAARQFAPVLKLRGLSPRDRGKLLSSTAVATLLYGCETWTVTAKIRRKLERQLHKLRSTVMNLGVGGRTAFLRKPRSHRLSVLRNRTKRVFSQDIRDLIAKRRLVSVLKNLVTAPAPLTTRLMSAQLTGNYGRKKSNRLRATYHSSILEDFVWVSGMDDNPRERFNELVSRVERHLIGTLEEPLQHCYYYNEARHPIVRERAVRLRALALAKVEVKKIVDDLFARGAKYRRTRKEPRLYPPGTRKFECSSKYCAARFGSVSARNRHERAAHGAQPIEIRPYPCPTDGCNKAYKTEGHLRRHQNLYHT